MRLVKLLKISTLFLLCGCAIKDIKRVEPQPIQTMACNNSYYIESVTSYEDYERTKSKNKGSLLASLRSKYNGTDADVKNGNAIRVKVSVFDGFHEKLNPNENHDPGMFFLITIFYRQTQFRDSVRVEIEKSQNNKNAESINKSTTSVEYTSTTWFWNLFWNSWETLITNPLDEEILKTIIDELARCPS